MEDGVNGPPTVPEAAKVTPGETPRAPGAMTVRATEREVFPFPLDVLLNWTVSEKEPAESVFAAALRDTVMFVVPFGARVPEVADKVSQDCDLETLQLSDAPPELVRV